MGSDLKLLAITGGMGSGKSTVSSLFSDKGAVILDADQMTRLLQTESSNYYDAEMMAEIFNKWPSTRLGKTELNRSELARIVFSDRQELKHLENIIHPRVRKQIAKEIESINSDLQLTKREPKSNKALYGVVILDIPLLFESSYDYSSDAYPVIGSILVSTPVELAVDRLMQSRDLSEQEVRKRLANQMPLDQKTKLADYIIDNSGNLSDLEYEVQKCSEWIISLTSE